MTSPWLRLIRIHTASLTQPVILLGLVLADVRIGWRWIPYALFAVIYHAGGFLQNNILDFRHDKLDPAKAHFPLISGEVSLGHAKGLFTGLTVLTLLLGLGLSQGRWLSIIFLISVMGFGWLYNYRCKRDVLSPAYIAAAFVSLPVFSYFAHALRLTPLVIWTLSYIAFLMLFQIAVEGYMKDIQSDKVSLLKRLGTTYHEDGRVEVGFRTKLLAWSLKVPGLILFIIIWRLSGSDTYSLWLGLTFASGIGGASYMLLKSGMFDNRKRVRLCAIIEVLSYILLVIALQGKMGWSTAIFFIFYPIGWFILLNRLTWNTWITPRV